MKHAMYVVNDRRNVYERLPKVCCVNRVINDPVTLTSYLRAARIDAENYPVILPTPQGGPEQFFDDDAQGYARYVCPAGEVTFQMITQQSTEILEELFPNEEPEDAWWKGMDDDDFQMRLQLSLFGM